MSAGVLHVVTSMQRLHTLASRIVLKIVKEIFAACKRPMGVLDVQRLRLVRVGPFAIDLKLESFAHELSSFESHL